MSQFKLTTTQKLIPGKQRPHSSGHSRPRRAPRSFVAAIIAMTLCLALLPNVANLIVEASKTGSTNGPEQKRAGKKKRAQSSVQVQQQDQVPDAEQAVPLAHEAPDYATAAAKINVAPAGVNQPLVAMTFTVTNTLNTGAGSLRQAITDANANIDPANPDTIEFNITPAGGVKTINLTSALPQITDPVIINGYTQPGSSANTLASGNDAVLLIELNGTSAGGANGLDINTDNCVIRGLVVNRFPAFGITTRAGGENNTIAGNFVGTDPGGTIDRGNTGVGVNLLSSNNTIGGTAPADRNVISGNNSFGVQVNGTSGALTANKVQGNYIGTNEEGTAALGNSSSGVAIFSSNNHTIGGTVAGAGNVISGNTFEVQISNDPADNNKVQGNIVGLDRTGTVDIDTAAGDGVFIGTGADNNEIGGATAAARNILSGNNQNGVQIDGSGTTGNIVQGNYIGTDITGGLDLGNTSKGILVDNSATNTTIGGTAAGAGNVISGNASDGVEIDGAASTGSTIQGNFIGTNAAGTAIIGNLTGVRLDKVPNTTVGGTTAGARNLISGNGAAGVQIIASSATGNSVLGNLIGTDINGTADLGSGSFGVIITGGAGSNTIGGTTAAARNIISGNGTGIAIEGGLVDAGGNTVQGNFIGTDITGTLPLANSSDGVSINFSPNNTIGGAAPGAGNLISNNQDNGVLIEGDATSGNNTVQNNAIAGSGGDGVLVDSSTQNTIETNSISASGGLGIDLNPNNVTANDTSDPDSGANNLQNFPILNLPVNSGGNTNISGTLNSTPSTQFRLEFFSNSTCDASGFGEGQTFAGTINVITLASGNVNFTHVIPAIPAGHFLTATATAPNGDTSEFSQCAQEGPPAVSLSFSSAAIDDSQGNSNGLIDVNECLSLNVELRNRGAVGATGISTVLSSLTPGVTVSQANSAYPDIATGNTASNTIPFKISVPADFGCGSAINLRITATTNQGVFIVDFQLPTNVPSVTNTFNSTGPAVPIPDDETNAADMPLTVSGITGPITKVRVRMHITHALTEDLDISLVGPDGTEVFLSLGNGSGANFGTNCPADGNDTIFDDDAATAIFDGVNPFTGTFQPDDELSAFINKSGASVNGTWNLHVEDFFSGDSGSIQCWSLEIISTPAVTATFGATGPIAIPDNNPGGAELPVVVSSVTGPIAKVMVNLHLTHGATHNLDISLVGPDGTTVNLSDDNGTGANYGTDCPASANDTIFDDAGVDPIIFGDNPFTGSFQPEALLSAFNGKSGPAVNGTWKLLVADDEAGTVGNIQCWTLTILTVTCASASGACSPTAADATISGNITASDGSPVSGTVVNLNGTQSRKTITDAKGRYRFDNVETTGFYTVTPSRVNYAFSPGNRSFSQLGNHTDAAFTGSSGGDSFNPLDTPEYFVRQQYVDLLGREPDEGGFNYWSDEILRCAGDAACMSARRRDIAAAFFIEQEFQQTGSFIHGLYKASLGRKPFYAEYSADRKQVVGGPNLDADQAAFAESFVQRTEFVTKYQSQVTAESFVDALLEQVWETSKVALAGDRTLLLAIYQTGSSTNQSRARVLQHVIAAPAFKGAEYNPAFVLTEYFAYLRRDPEPEGYDFWLNVLNHREPGNFRGMVCSFITSTEYQQRFSSVVTHSNAECGR